MASSIRHPLRPLCFIRINLIALVLFLSAATCHSESQPRKTDSGNGDVQMPIPYSLRLPSAKQEDSDCGTGCHQTPKTVDGESDEETTVKKPDLAERYNESSRYARSLPEDVQNAGHQRESRAGALNKNFLRFGRGNLNKNFLRFGRGGNLKQNFLRFGRGGLQKNFLRFGRKDAEYDFNSGEKSDMGLVEKLSVNDESTDLRSSDNLIRAIERLRSEMAENEADDMQNHETDDSLVEMDANGSTVGGSGAFEMEENGAKVKRGSLSNNFLRFGRNYNRQNMFSGKRGSLNRNFLRFGKRSGPPNVSTTEGRSQEGTGNKAKREVAFDEADENKAFEKLPVQSNMKQVLFLSSPWLNKELSTQPEEPRSVHEVSIRRRSLDENLASQLQNRFLRFGRL